MGLGFRRVAVEAMATKMSESVVVCDGWPWAVLLRFGWSVRGRCTVDSVP